jgi:putative flippase GtrA
MTYARIKRNLPKLVRFGCVGTLGAVINFLTYYGAVEFAHFSINVAAIISFCVAVTNNYILNHLWTFGAENKQNNINMRQYIYYFLGNIFGLAINLTILNFVIFYAGKEEHFIGQGAGILCGMLSNFIIAKKFVFIKKMI